MYRSRGSGAALPAVLGATGLIAVTRLGPIPVIDAPTVDITGDPSRPAPWSPDGTTLAISFLDYGADGCSPYSDHGLAVVRPGGPVRVLIAPGERDLEVPNWSPDGTRLAIDVGPDFTVKRGRSHAWPKRIARNYGMTRPATPPPAASSCGASRSLRQDATPRDRDERRAARLDARRATPPRGATRAGPRGRRDRARPLAARRRLPADRGHCRDRLLSGRRHPRAVIVWLKDDHAILNLRSSDRVAAAHDDQKPVVATVRDNGGTVDNRDASSIDAQGTVLYQYSKELPYSGMPDSCSFKLVGDAPGASLVDTNTIDTSESIDNDPPVERSERWPESTPRSSGPCRRHQRVLRLELPGQLRRPLRGERRGRGRRCGRRGLLRRQRHAARCPHRPRTRRSSRPRDEHLRLNAMPTASAGWVNKRHHAALLRWDDPEYKLVDLVAPGHGGEAACNPHGSDCPTNTQTEAFDGSSQSSPLIVGAAVDVTQAYRDSYNGDSPSPALVKQLLTGTATDVDAPADQQGAGLVNINAAVAAAQQQPVTSVATHTTMTGNPPRTRTVNGVPLTGGSVTFHVPNPMAGTGRSTSSSTSPPVARSSPRRWWATCWRRRRRSRPRPTGRRPRADPVISGTDTPGDTVRSRRRRGVCTAPSRGRTGRAPLAACRRPGH